MAEHFNRHGVAAVAIWGDSPPADREAALRDLAAGAIRVVFSVDLFNEGVDVPAVDTVLMLRPTESPTLFLQQLGRGLAPMKGKTFCTVLDFVGTHRSEFRFDRRYRALLGGTRRDVERAVQQRFPFLPAGCHMHLDEKASEIVLRSLRDAIPARWPARVEELRVVDAAYRRRHSLELPGRVRPRLARRLRRPHEVVRPVRGRRCAVLPADSTRSRCARRSDGYCTSTTTNESRRTAASSVLNPSDLSEHVRA